MKATQQIHKEREAAKVQTHKQLLKAIRNRRLKARLRKSIRWLA